MDEEYPLCPECGYALSLTMEIDSKTNEIRVDLFCEGPGDDEYHLQIQTGLNQDDIELFDKVGGEFPIKAVLKERKADPYQKI